MSKKRVKYVLKDGVRMIMDDKKEIHPIVKPSEEELLSGLQLPNSKGDEADEAPEVVPPVKKKTAKKATAKKATASKAPVADEAL